MRRARVRRRGRMEGSSNEPLSDIMLALGCPPKYSIVRPW
jgi:hypothetical protein